MSDNSEIQKQLDGFFNKLTETIFLGVQEKTKEVSGLHREIREDLKTLKTDVSSINAHLEKLNSKVATHESKFNEVAIKHATDDEKLKAIIENQSSIYNGVKWVVGIVIGAVVLALLGTVIK